MIIDLFKGEYGFLSNFYSTEIEYKGLTYPNAEAAFQAQKCADDEARLKYTKKMSPVIAKRMGRKEPYLPADWNEKAFYIMADIVKAKFSNSELKEKLLATGDAVLIEGNHWHDNRWGHCTCEKCQNKEYTNWLGKILMQVRSEISERNKPE